MISQGKFKILSNRKIGLDYFKMKIYAPKVVQEAWPGQFVHLRCQESLGPLLRRPFSFHRLNQSNFEILYKVIGQGTKLLAKKQKGDIVDVLGPLGNGFDAGIRDPGSRIPDSILVAGGMGVAPLVALAEKLVEAQSSKLKAQRKNNILVLLGAKNKKMILCEGDFRKLGLSIQLATDDGSKGFKGFVSDLLRNYLSTINYKLSTIYACGPKPMLKEVGRIAKGRRIPAYASLEEKMACGVGACLGCAVKTKSGYKRVCKDGPVFNLKEIKW